MINKQIRTCLKAFERDPHLKPLSLNNRFFDFANEVHAAHNVRSIAELTFLTENAIRISVHVNV